MEHLLKIRKNSIIEEPVQRIIIGVAGGSAAGKTTLCQNINRQMAFDRNFKVQILSFDCFYKNIDKKTVNVANYNFDHPSAIDFDLAYQTLKLMKQSNEKVPIPQYSFTQHQRLPEPTYANPANIILFEGLMAFHDSRIRDLMTYKVFITCDDDIRLCRRLKRDTTQRGRSIESVLAQYNRFVKDSFRDFILPTIIYADIIIPGFRNNRVSVDFIVQHIKNIARRITFKQRASKTKIYIFGENELYDLEYQQTYQTEVSLFQQSFLVFPTAEQHKKQLQFFLNRLLNQSFSHEYYEQIYICQFVKVAKSLFNQLIQLKGFKLDDIQIMSRHNISQIRKYNISKKPVKLIFFPFANSRDSKQIKDFINQIRATDKNTTFVILTLFCDIKFPSLIYKLGTNNVILINLFVISNDYRFKESMQSNILHTENENWLTDDTILANQGAYVIAKDIKIIKNYISDWTIQEYKYNQAVLAQKQGPRQRKIDQHEQIVQPFHQLQVYSQQHQNLCGYHTLINIILRTRDEHLKSKSKFIKYYHILSKIVRNENYSPLERNHVQEILKNNYFKDVEIGQFYYAFNYIINSQQDIAVLDKLFKSFHQGRTKQFLIIMGVFNHFFLLEVRKDKILFIDSNNTRLKDIMNQADTQFQEQHKDIKIDDEKLKQHKSHMKNIKEALQIVQKLYENKKKLRVILVEKRIDEIAGPFLKLKEEEYDAWFKDQYPVPTITNDLLKPLSKIDIASLSQQHQKVLMQFRNNKVIKAVCLVKHD